MFLDWGDGWKSVNDHAEDVAALAGFSIQWGTDDLAEQPEPSVMSFTLRDRTGWLTGRALTLAGARVLVQISEQPTWGMLRDDMGPWSAQHTRVEAMHQAYTPGLPSKFAIVAPQDLYFGLGRMYESLRESAPHSSRRIAAFRSRAEAERWLDAPVDEPAEADFT